MVKGKKAVFLKGQVIYEPGQQPRYLYSMLSGEVRMVTVNEEGKEFIQGIFRAGQYFGEPALLLNRPYLAYTIASADTELVMTDRGQLLNQLQQDSAFSLEMIMTLSNRLFYKSMMLEELGNEQAEHRLLTLVDYLGLELQPGDTLPVTRKALADMSGLRVETTIRTIRKLASSGAIKLIRGKIVKG